MSWLARNRTPLIVLAVAFVLMALGFRGYYTSDGAAKARERDARMAEAKASGAQATAPTLQVDVMLAKRSPDADVVELAGVLEPVRATWVASEMAGRVVSIPAAEHAPIEKGDVLVQLDASLPRAEVIRAEASHELAKVDLDRQERLPLGHGFFFLDVDLGHHTRSGRKDLVLHLHGLQYEKA